MMSCTIRRVFRFGVLLTAIASVGARPRPTDIAVVPSAAVAAPWLIVVHGPPLQQWVLLSDWHENHALLVSRRPPSDPERAGWTQRPYLKLALFWGREWRDYPRTPEALARLRPDQQGQQARFYPGYGSQPPLMSGVGSLQVVEDEGLRVLARHGIPLRLD